MKIKIAFIQLIPGKSNEENLSIGKKACIEAKEKGADIALFPEMWSDGYALPQDMDVLQTLAVEKESEFVNTFRDGKRFWKINQNTNMKFDAIVGNPPYQVMDGGNSASALPVYQYFVDLGKRITPIYISMITPSRWFAGGRGLDEYRDKMLHDEKIEKIVDFADSQECFPSVIISGGISYFLWSKTHCGDCLIVNSSKGTRNEMKRQLNEFPVFVRSNHAISIIRKTSVEGHSLSQEVLPSNPFGFRTYVRGEKMEFKGCLKFIHSEGVGYVSRTEVEKSQDAIDTYNVITTRAIFICEPGAVVTESYVVVASFKKESEAINCLSYLKTKFFRLLCQVTIVSPDVSARTFELVPLQDFTRSWTDADLYAKYGLTDEEIQFIESMIKPME